MGHQSISAHRLTRLRAAHLNHVPRGRHTAKVVVVRDDPVHFGTRKVQRVGDGRHLVGGDVAEQVLHVVKDRQQRAGFAGMACQYLPDSGGVVGFWRRRDQ